MKKNNNKSVILEAEHILSKCKDKKNKNYLYLKRVYNQYNKDTYHDSITDKMYIEKLEEGITRYYKKSNRRLVFTFSIIFCIISLISGYFICSYIDKVSKSNDGIIEVNNNYLIVKYFNLKNVTREKNSVTINLKSISNETLKYTIYAVTDEITKLKYEILANNVNYGTNVLKSKRNSIYTGYIKPNSEQAVYVNLWQNENYNINSQLRFYVDATN